MCLGRLEPVGASDLAPGRAARLERSLAAFVPGTLPGGMGVAGAANGEARPGGRPGRRRATGPAGRGRLRLSGQPVDMPEVDPESTAATPLWRVRGTRGKAFVDLQNDVTDDDVALAEHEGFRAVEHLKRYTTLGMATDQGKTSNVNGLALMAELTAKHHPADRHDDVPPALRAGAIGALAGHAPRQGLQADAPAAVARLGAGAGRRVRRDRLLAARAVVSAARRGATGSRASTARCATVRASVGVCDVSTLGKIDLQGADAA